MPLSTINANANDNDVKIHKSISAPPRIKHEMTHASTIRKYRQTQQQHLVPNNNDSISSKNKKRTPTTFCYFRDNNGKQVIDFLLKKGFHAIYVMDDISLSLRKNMKSNCNDNNC